MNNKIFKKLFFVFLILHNPVFSQFTYDGKWNMWVEGQKNNQTLVVDAENRVGVSGCARGIFSKNDTCKKISSTMNFLFSVQDGNFDTLKTLSEQQKSKFRGWIIGGLGGFCLFTGLAIGKENNKAKLAFSGCAFCSGLAMRYGFNNHRKLDMFFRDWNPST